MIRLTGLPPVAAAPGVRLERSTDAVVLWFLGDADAAVVHRVTVPLYALAGEEDLEAVELDVLAQLQRLGYDARRIAPRADP